MSYKPKNVYQWKPFPAAISESVVSLDSVRDGYYVVFSLETGRKFEVESHTLSGKSTLIDSVPLDQWIKDNPNNPHVHDIPTPRS